MKTHIYQIKIYGRVWGVGFRPFIYKLATSMNLRGEVKNSEQGVIIKIHASKEQKNSLISMIYKHLPPLARIDGMDICTLPTNEISLDNISVATNEISLDGKTAPNTASTANTATNEISHKFIIAPSIHTDAISSFLPDFGLCDECRADMRSSDERRYLYAYTTCTNCGPRYSLMRALPYDRHNTTMDRFALCDECLREYTDPDDRRFNAQVISCAKCGVKTNLLIRQTNEISLDDKTAPNTATNEIRTTNEISLDDASVANHTAPNATQQITANTQAAIIKAATLIKQGKILAIKSTGGYHLVTDATNHAAISRLRTLKHREHKPLAIMCRDIDMASSYAIIDDDSAAQLLSIARPIVLCKSRRALPSAVHFELARIGVFLPPNGLYELLFDHLDTPIIATSANPSSQPLIYTHEQLQMLDIWDAALDNDREIIHPSDDSLLAMICGKSVFFRLSRAYRPDMLISAHRADTCVLALGAEQKCEFAIYKNGLIYLSPYIGDIKSSANLERLIACVADFVRIYGFVFDAVVCDMHPDFLHTRYFASLDWAGFYTQCGIDKITQTTPTAPNRPTNEISLDNKTTPNITTNEIRTTNEISLDGTKSKRPTIIKVQHHHAHALSVMSEHSLDSALCFCFDGTGYAPNTAPNTTQNTAPTNEILPRIWGGEVLVCSGDRYDRLYHFDEFVQLPNATANAHSVAYSILRHYDLPLPSNLSLPSALHTIYDKRLNCTISSSLGRIFDGFGALVLGCTRNEYDGHIGMMIEAHFDKNIKEHYDYEIQDGVIIYKQAIAGALNDSASVACTKFIRMIARIIKDIAARHDLPVVLSGGVFSNLTLLECINEEFSTACLQYHQAKNFCQNDSNIAYGQINYYLRRLQCAKNADAL